MDTDLNIVLADDDSDDCMLFELALSGLQNPPQLTVVNNGNDLIKLLIDDGFYPDIIFLDLNMPLKNGFQCLQEIQNNENLNQIPVVIISTSFEEDIANVLYRYGAKFYIRKPNEFPKLKNMIINAISLTLDLKSAQPSFEDFVVLSESLHDERY